MRSVGDIPILSSPELNAQHQTSGDYCLMSCKILGITKTRPDIREVETDALGSRILNLDPFLASPFGDDAPSMIFSVRSTIAQSSQPEQVFIFETSSVGLKRTVILLSFFHRQFCLGWILGC